MTWRWMGIQCGLNIDVAFAQHTNLSQLFGYKNSTKITKKLQISTLWDQLRILCAHFIYVVATIYNFFLFQCLCLGLYTKRRCLFFFFFFCHFVFLLGVDVRLIPSPVAPYGLHERDTVVPQMTRTEITETDFKPTLSCLLYIVPSVYFTAPQSPDVNVEA